MERIRYSRKCWQYIEVRLRRRARLQRVVVVVEEEDPSLHELDRLMRERPKPGRAGGAE